MKQVKLLNRYVMSMCLAFIFNHVMYANDKIVGRVIDNKNQPIEFATVALLNSKTKELVKGGITNQKGEFMLDKLNSGSYMLTVSIVGYDKFQSETVDVDATKNRIIEKNIILGESVHQLGSVQVVAKKKFIEQTVDKMVINPEASITSAAENVFEILKKLPGVSIDNADNISLKGKQGIKVMIDDKPTYLSSEQLSSLLKSMQGRNIDKIEIIENPAARYDAEGNSGIINIRTKHNKALGLNGSLNTGMSYSGRYKENAGLDINMNFGKLNVYGNYSFYDWNNWNDMRAVRNFLSTNLAGSSQHINKFNDYNGNAHNYKIGSDLILSKGHVLSVMFIGNSGWNKNDNKGTTEFISVNNRVDSLFLINTPGINNWNNETYNVNYKWDIDSTGRSLTVDADYARFHFDSNNNQNGSFYIGNNIQSNRNLGLRTIQSGDIEIRTARLDYIHPLNKIYSFESGLKSSLVTNNSLVGMSGYINQFDDFNFIEEVNAAYLSGRAQYPKTSIQLGLRLENTTSKGISKVTSHEYPNSYLQLFPSLFIKQTLTDNQYLNFRYSYRIGRPNFNNINPFVWMLDPYTYEKGNPLLKPQFTHSSGLSHSYKGMFITSIGFSYTNDLFSEIIIQDDAKRVIYKSVDNLNNSINMNASETMQFELAKWWRLNGTITGTYREISAKNDGVPSLRNWEYKANMSTNISLPYKIGMELSGYYASKQLMGNSYYTPNFGVDLGFQYKVFNDNGIIRVSVNDIFQTSNAQAYVKSGNVDLKIDSKNDTRKLNVAFIYRFGKNDFKTRSNRSTASSEEQGRSSK
jgi:iron complex outermembrane receptor protein